MRAYISRGNLIWNAFAFYGGLHLDGMSVVCIYSRKHLPHARISASGVWHDVELEY